MSRATPGYLGSYRLLNVVSTGHAAQMWQAYHDGRQEFVAIKALSEKFRKDRQQIAYLKREYVVGSKLDHPRVIRVIEFGIDRGVPYLAMEWFAAPNMKQRIKQGVETFSHLIPTIILQATEAVVYFHNQGWIHRDIKPENFLVSDTGDLKLIDFALAQRKAGLLARLLGSRSKVQGTRSYMSPEQIRGQALDERADLYSLACTLFELVTGRPPFSGANSNELLNKHLRAAPPSPETFNRNVTPEFSQLIRRALAKAPSERFNSVGEFYRELRGIKIFRQDPSPPLE